MALEPFMMVARVDDIMNRTVIVAAAVAAALLIAGGALYFYRSSSESGGSAGAERAEEAREFIAAREDEGPKGYAEAYERARELQLAGRLADAQLLYFYAARGGYSDAEFQLAAMNDPNHHTKDTSLLPEPDAFQAFKWYSSALEHGSQEASVRLAELHEWATEAAAGGDPAAERLLLQWARR